jgi:hypothetical protein
MSHMSETIRANPHGQTYPFRVDGTTPILPIFDQAAVLDLQWIDRLRGVPGTRHARRENKCELLAVTHVHMLAVIRLRLMPPACPAHPETV